MRACRSNRHLREDKRRGPCPPAGGLRSFRASLRVASLPKMFIHIRRNRRLRQDDAVAACGGALSRADDTRKSRGGRRRGSRPRILLDAIRSSIRWPRCSCSRPRASACRRGHQGRRSRRGASCCATLHRRHAAYQGSGGCLDLDRLRALNDWGTGSLSPDRTLLFDIDEQTGLRRARAGR